MTASVAEAEKELLLCPYIQVQTTCSQGHSTFYWRGLENKIILADLVVQLWVVIQVKEA